MKKTISEDDLHAYVDGALSPQEREEVEAHLKSDAAAAARVRAYHAQNEAMRRAFESVLTEPHTLRAPSAAAANETHFWRRAAALAATLMVGMGIGYLSPQFMAGDAAPRSSFAQQAVLAHVAYVPEVRHPVEVPAQEEQHLVGWLSKRLSAPLKAPSLDASGYRMLGGRLLPAADSVSDAPVALLMYESAKGKRLSLLVKREALSSDTAFRFSQNGDTRVFYWVDGPFGYALAGDIDRDELGRLAKIVYQQLNP